MCFDCISKMEVFLKYLEINGSHTFFLVFNCVILIRNMITYHNMNNIFKWEIFH